MRRYLHLCVLMVAVAWGIGTPSACASTDGSPTPPGGSGVSVDSTPPVDTTADWTRFDWDAGRSGAATVPTGIGAGNVGSLHKQQVQLDGTVDASPIYLHDVRVGDVDHDVFFVTTTYGKTEAVDADTGEILWSYVPPQYGSWAGSRQITTATPVADPDRNALYAASPGGTVAKLRVSDGQVLWKTAVTQLPRREKIASALNLHDGHLLVTTGGYIGDAPPYQGHVAVLDASSGELLHVWNALCSDRAGLLDPSSCSESGAAIWGRAGAVVDTTSGNVFVTTGDGRWDGRTFWGDAVLELDPLATRLLGNFTPENTDELDRSDTDLGSTAPVLLGRSLVAQGGKDHQIRLLDWSAMRGGEPHRGGAGAEVQTPSGARLFTAPVVWRHGSTTWLFAADNGGTAAWTVSGGGWQERWRNDHAGTSPVLAGGLLWVYDPGGGLRAYEPTSGRLLGVLQCGPGHWNSPIVVDGRVALPEGDANDHATSGVLDIWRLP